MNKKTLRIAGWALGLSMAVSGIAAVTFAPLSNLLQVDAAGTVYTIDTEIS